ncbi:MAG: phosphatidate cytidylyltransferase [Phycisphaerae bacterium]|nr:phosphatidate cytidylyltransferase [Phycisphaerae bacterium]
MIKRVVFGTAMIAVLAGAFLLDWYLDIPSGAPLAIILLPLLWLGFVEFARMAKSAGVRILWPAGFIGVSLIAIIPILQRLQFTVGHGGVFWYEKLLQILGNPFITPGLVILLIFLNQMISGRLDDALRRIACTFLGVFYLGVGGAAMLSLRSFDNSGLLILFLAAVKCTDIGAFFVGSAIGKHKMIPWLSPGKSWEGLFGGLLAAAIVGVVGWWIDSIQAEPAICWSLEQFIVFCAVVGLAGQFADLCESLLKRSAGVKDSGALVPEFGGILDIMDSPLLAAPVAMAIARILYG